MAVRKLAVWEIVFLMVMVEIPIVYLCSVVYYAIKAEPKPEEGAAVTARIGPGRSGLPLAPARAAAAASAARPHGGPSRTYPRTAARAPPSRAR